jgi:hypothetical protein
VVDTVSRAPGGRSIELRDLAAGPWAVFVHSPSRSAALRVGFGLARARDPNPTWVEIRDPSAAIDPPGPAELGWIPEDRLFLATPGDARPEHGVANMALWNVVRSDEPSATVAGLADFLRLPTIVQDAVSRVGSENPRPVLVVANTDRVRSAYPRDAPGIRPFLDAMLGASVLPIFLSLDPAGPGRMAFDVVLEIRSPDAHQWRSASLVCEKAPADSTLPVGDPVPLPDLSGMAELFEPYGRPPAN